MNTSSKPHVGLFATCLVDAMRPSIGHASIKLLEDAGCTVSIPESQTCCGQPGLNSGATDAARVLAQQLIEQFEAFDYVVLPSGSCAGTLKMHYPELFDDDPAWHERAKSVADKTWELMSFLVEVMQYRPDNVSLDTVATYHDSCAGLRELRIKQQPRDLLASISGLTLKPLPGNEVCCGFGGTFCVKYPDISGAIVSEKADDIKSTGAQMLLGGDLGCLMNMSGKLSRQGSSVRVMHAAEVLAGMGDAPAMGEAD